MSSRSNQIRARAQSSPSAPVPVSNDPSSQVASSNTASDTVPDPPVEAVLLQNAGIPGPIPEDFDFDGRVVIPDGISRFQLSLAVRVRENAAIEDFNDASILQTVNVKNTPVPRPLDLDIGPPLKPLYLYTKAEIQDLIDSEALCALLSPLPPSLLRDIVASRVQNKRQAETERQTLKEKDKEVDDTIRSKLLGSMGMANPVERSLGESRDVVIPTIYLLNIRNRFPPPLHFFTNRHIDLVNNSPQMIHTKVVRSFNSDDRSTDKVLLLDIAKMIQVWGNDDSHLCLTPMRFIEASKNLREALNFLGKKPSEADPADGPTSSSTNHAIEYGKHLNFFRQIENFEDTYPLWYKFEREARLDILMANVVFNWSKYASRVDVILQSHNALLEDRRRMSESKVPRFSYASDATSHRSITKNNPLLFRDAAPACLLCGKAHRFTEHPANITSFEDGKPLYARLIGNQLVTAKNPRGGRPLKICGVFNLNRPCDNRHGNEAIHVCSLCGGDHPAFARSRACLRILNGRICA